MARVEHAGPVPEAFETASTGRRIGAWLVDFVLLYVIVSVVAALFGGVHGVTRSATMDYGSTVSASTYTIEGAWFGSLLSAFSAVYTIPMWKARGATIGQLMFGLRVFDAAGPVRLSWRQASIRWFGLFGWAFIAIPAQTQDLLLLTVIVWLVALVVSTVRNERGQGLHDRFARSLVVNRGEGRYSPWD